MDLTAKDVLELAIGRASETNTYWNLYVAGATVVLGASAKGFAERAALRSKVLLTVVFAAFAYSNLTAIIALGVLRSALLDMLPADLPNRTQVLSGLSPSEPWQYWTLHLLMDAFVVVAVWFAREPREADA